MSVEVDEFRQQFIENGTNAILRNTGLTEEDLARNQPVLDVGCGIGFIGRSMRKKGIRVLSADPKPTHLGRRLILELAEKKLLALKPKTDLPYFLTGVRQLKAKMPYAEAVRTQLERHMVLVSAEEAASWEPYCNETDDLPVICESADSMPSVANNGMGLVLSHRAPPLHPLTTLAAMQAVASRIAQVLRPGGACHMGPGPVCMHFDGNAIVSGPTRDIETCARMTLDVLRAVFESYGNVEEHRIADTQSEEPESRYYVFRKKRP